MCRRISSSRSDDGRWGRRSSCETTGPNIGRRRVCPGPFRYIQRSFVDLGIYRVRLDVKGEGDTACKRTTSSVSGRSSVFSMLDSGASTESPRCKGGGCGGIDSVNAGFGANEDVPTPASFHAGGASRGTDRSMGRRAEGDGVAEAKRRGRIFPLGGARNGAASMLDVLFAELTLLTDFVRSTSLPLLRNSSCESFESCAISSSGAGDVAICGRSGTENRTDVDTPSGSIHATCAARTTQTVATGPGPGDGLIT